MPLTLKDPWTKQVYGYCQKGLYNPPPFFSVPLLSQSGDLFAVLLSQPGGLLAVLPSPYASAPLLNGDTDHLQGPSSPSTNLIRGWHAFVPTSSEGIDIEKCPTGELMGQQPTGWEKDKTHRLWTPVSRARQMAGVRQGSLCLKASRVSFYKD